MTCPARSLMRSPTSTLSSGRAALCTWAATHNVSLFHTILKMMPPMVRGCRLLIEAHGHYLHVLYAVNDMTNTFELFFCLSFLHVKPPLRCHRPLEVTVHALRCLDAVCVAPSVIPTTAIRQRRFSCSWAATFPSRCSWWNPSSASSGATCCN